MPADNQEVSVTLAELRAAPLAVVKRARKPGHAIVVTSKGKPDVVVLSAADFERRLKLTNLALLIAEAEADVAAGRIRSAREFFAEFRRGKEVSR